MDKDILSDLSFEDYIVEKIEFSMNKDFYPQKDIELDLKFDRSIEIDYENGESIITLGCIAFEECEKKNYPFTLNVIINGFFKFNNDLELSKIENLLEVNGTAILFPYLRMIVSAITSNSGIPPLVIPTINIVNMIRREEKKEMDALK